MLDERSPVPLYYQLQEIIRGRIESGQWGPGQQLPPEAELCQEFNLSRGTVRQALGDLVRDGLLHRRRGKGSFVAAPKIQQEIQMFAGFTDYVKKVLGTELGNKLISAKVVRADDALASAMEIPEGTELAEIRKVKLMEDRPFFVTVSYIPSSLAVGIEKDDHSKGSLIQLLRSRYGFKTAKMKGWFEPVLVTDYEASLLGVDRGSPAMLYHRVRYSADDRALVFTKNVIRGDMCRITFQLSDAEDS